MAYGAQSIALVCVALDAEATTAGLVVQPSRKCVEETPCLVWQWRGARARSRSRTSAAAGGDTRLTTEYVVCSVRGSRNRALARHGSPARGDTRPPTFADLHKSISIRTHPRRRRHPVTHSRGRRRHRRRHSKSVHLAPCRHHPAGTAIKTRRRRPIAHRRTTPGTSRVLVLPLDAGTTWGNWAHSPDPR